MITIGSIRGLVVLMWCSFVCSVMSCQNTTVQETKGSSQIASANPASQPVSYSVRQLRLVPPDGITGVSSMAFLPDGVRLIYANDNDGPKLLDTATGQILRQFDDGVQSTAVALSSDGKKFAMEGRGSSVKLVDMDTGQMESVVEPAELRKLFDVAISPDGKSIATASTKMGTAFTFRGEVRISDAATGKRRVEFAVHDGPVYSVAFSPDSTILAVGCGNRLIVHGGLQALPCNLRLVNTSTGDVYKTVAAHSGEISCLAFSPDGTLLATGSADRTVKVWELKTMSLRYAIKGLGEGVKDVAFSPDGKLLATAETYDVKLWDVATGMLELDMSGVGYPGHTVCFSPRGDRMATGNSDHGIVIWAVSAAPGRGKRQ